jgi:hypothetical protein
MWEQLEPWLKEQGRRLLQGLGAALLLLARGLRAAWVLIRPSIVFALNVLVALLLLFEEWGWRPLSNLVAQLARFRIWALTELWIAGLPPYGALVALGIPSAILIPAKLFGVYLLALGHVVTAAVVLIAAKLASTALIARIFLLTKPALMQIGWFQRAYDLFVPWQEALFAWIRASWVWRYGRVVKWRVGGTLRRTWRTLKPRLQAGARKLWMRASFAGERLLRRLQGPHG